MTNGPGQIKYIQLTNLSNHDIIIGQGASLDLWMAFDMILRSPGYASVDSRRYKEWQTLAFEATTERKEEALKEYSGPLVDHLIYERPTQILSLTDRSRRRNRDIGEELPQPG